MKKKLVLAGTTATAMLVGGVIGASLIGSASADTTPSPSSGTTGGTTMTPATPWHSNTDPSHEAGESAARQAEEKTADASGVRPAGDGGPGGFGGHSNTDPAHEAGESAAHAAEEKARDAAAPSPSPSG